MWFIVYAVRRFVLHTHSLAHTHGRRSNVNTQKTAVLTTGTILNYMHRDYPKGYLQRERKEKKTQPNTDHSTIYDLSDSQLIH